MRSTFIIGWILVLALGSQRSFSHFIPAGDNVSESGNWTTLDAGSEILGDFIIPSYVRDLFNKATPKDDLVKGLSPACAAHSLSFFAQVEKFSQTKSIIGVDLWALQSKYISCNISDGLLRAWGNTGGLHPVMDSFAKIPEGILSGHLNPMGDFDECLGVKATDLKYSAVPEIPSSFAGKYCTVYVIPTPPDPVKADDAHAREVETKKAGAPLEVLKLIGSPGVTFIPSVGTCFPDSCSNEEMKILMINILSRYSLSSLITPSVFYCTTQEKPGLDAADYSVIILLGFLVGLALLSGAVDMWSNYGSEKPPKRGLALQYFFAFSLYTNIKKWLNTRCGGDDLGCIHGIRFLSTAWVILAHTWYVVTFIPQWNMVDAKNVQDDWSIMIVLNSTVSVDTFFVLSGMLVSYNLLKILEKSGGNFNLPLFYVHRYLRLTPTYAIIIGMMATIFPYFGSGPFWEWMERWSKICEDNWWTNLLYINNFVRPDRLCQGDAWYLAVDMQFYILSPLFIYPLWKWRKFGLGFLSLSTLVSIITPAVQIYYLDVLTPTTLATRQDPATLSTWFIDVYIKPYARIQTYLIGVTLGWIMFEKRGKKVHISKLVQLIGWAFTTATSLAVLFGIHPWFDPAVEIPKVGGMVYGSLNRFGWGLSISWIIFACCKGYGGLVNDFLSWKAFVPLGRLCFCAFLVSLHIQMIFHLSFRQPITYDPYTMINFYLAHMIVSFAVAFFCTLLMESPFIMVEKLVFEGAGSREKKVEAQQTPVQRFGIFYQKENTVINADGIIAKTEL